MTDLNDFLVDESKVWFGEYWPEGVPKQIYEVEDIRVESLYDGFINQAELLDLWDKDICIFVLGPYLERVNLRTLADCGKVWNISLRHRDKKRRCRCC